ncbi:hypothetical protein [Allorhizocola rhizosphaerae]|uniref:hypothetical protein n=1 Tax=Allorhizocola rhizosphaerae TaxID=1872709 RepID=UPI000E3D09C6|nr:hypothetical protein [Allorhizocola rhizosphaerae]
MTDPQEELTVLPALMNYRDKAPHAFVPPSLDSMEASAHRRHRRRVGLVAGATVLLIGAASAIAVAQLPRQDAPLLADPTPTASPTPSPSPSPSASPSPPSSSPSAPGGPSRGTEVVPRSAMLRPEDLGSGYTGKDSTGQGDWRMEYFTSICPTYRPDHYRGPAPARSGRREYSFRGPKDVIQSVGLGNVESNTWEMNHTRRWVADCASFSTNDMRYTIRIIASGFAGDDSLLVKVNQWHYVYLRKGEWLTQIAFRDPQTVTEMKEIAVKAAARLP